MQTITFILAALNAIIFLIVAAFHYYWAFGGKYAAQAVLPEIESSNKKVFQPGKFSTAVVATLFLVIAILFSQIFIQFNFYSTQLTFYFLYAIAAITFIRAIGDFKYVGFFKKKSDSLFAANDSKYYSPLCLFISITTLFIVLPLKIDGLS